MQLNIHVPKEREAVIAQLDAMAAAGGRPKNQVVLDALEAYLAPRRRSTAPPRLRPRRLGVRDRLHRADLYAERLEAKARPRPG